MFEAARGDLEGGLPQRGILGRGPSIEAQVSTEERRIRGTVSGGHPRGFTTLPWTLLFGMKTGNMVNLWFFPNIVSV